MSSENKSFFSSFGKFLKYLFLGSMGLIFLGVIIAYFSADKKIPSDFKQGVTLSITSSSSLLKKSPSLTAKTIFRPKENEQADYIDQSAPWVKIKLKQSKKIGWLHVSNLKRYEVQAPQATMAAIMCEKFATKKLKSPSTAKFAGVFDGVEAKFMRKDKKGWSYFIYNSWVDAQNTFGAKIRNNFSCQIKSKDNEYWELVHLKFHH